MAITVTPYLLFKKGQISGAHPVDFDTDTLKVTLHTATYTPDLDAHEFHADLTNEVANGSGYTTGGAALGNKAVGVNTGSDFAYFDADDTVWTTITKTFRYAVIRKDTGVSATSPLIALIDFGTNLSPAVEDFTIQWPAPASGGVLKFA